MWINFITFIYHIFIISKSAKSGLVHDKLHCFRIALPEGIIESLPGFHLFTGCHTTSSFSGKVKKTAFKLLVSEENYKLLTQIGDSWNVDEETKKLAERFLIKLYGSSMDNLNLARYQLFSERGLRDDQLPPTPHTFCLHLMRANYQAYLWKHANRAMLKPDDYTRHGWLRTETGSCGINFSEREAAPSHLVALTAHRCVSSQCRANACSCQKKGVVCIDSCRCTRTDCCNDEADTSDDK